MARKAKINLATAKVADGEVRGNTSIYAMCGIATTSYKHTTLAAYSKMINSLNLIELHDHAFQVGTLAGPDRNTLINRLEEKFLRENSKFSPAIGQPIEAPKGSSEARAEAERIISRGR